MAALLYYYCSFNSFVKSLNDCGVSAGPCLAIDVKDKVDDLIKIDTTIKFENGVFRFANIHDSIPFVVLKYNESLELNWAITIQNDSMCSMPFTKISNIKLNTKASRTPFISFYNEEYREPGKIYLKENFDFGYVCMSPF